MKILFGHNYMELHKMDTLMLSRYCANTCSLSNWQSKPKEKMILHHYIVLLRLGTSQKNQLTDLVRGKIWKIRHLNLILLLVLNIPLKYRIDNFSIVPIACIYGLHYWNITLENMASIQRATDSNGLNRWCGISNCNAEWFCKRESALTTKWGVITW